MRFCIPILLLPFAIPALAQTDLNVLTPAKGEPPADKLLYNYLTVQAKKHFDARRAEIAKINNPAEFKKRQKQLKKQFLEALGGFPKKTALNARVVGKIRKKDYIIERVIYESRPNHHVTANLYVPIRRWPMPGVLVPCGHSKNGKAATAYQRIAILLAKNGFVVLCYDPIGQGERFQLLNDRGKPAVPSSTSEHTLVGVGALLVGKSTATYRIWDGIRSIDYLASRPEVDSKRLGCTGNSGGGTMTAYLMALDERIKVAAPSCYITSLERLFATIGPQDAEQNIPGQVAFGMEHADYVTMRAPKPTLILTGTQDFFDIKGSRTTFREAKLLYGLLGFGERVSLFEYNDKHGFSKPRREACVRWMSRWLLKNDDAIVEPDFAVCSDRELQCTRSGQVLADFKGTSAFHLNAMRAQYLRKKRQAWLARASKEEVKKKVRALIALPQKLPLVKIKATWIRKQKGGEIRAYTFTPTSGVPIVVLTLSPSRPFNKSATIVLSEKGAADVVNSDRARKLLKQGMNVIAVDLRGMGETAPGRNRRAFTKYFGGEWREAFLCMHLNRPLLGQRTQDLLAVVNTAKALFKQKDVRLVAEGTAGPIALHAALLDDRIKHVTLERSLDSWDAVVLTPLSTNQLPNAVPGVLAWYDLPDLVRRIGPERVTVNNPVDPTGAAVSVKPN